MNVYGFANGDPVGYSDPYGLCPYGTAERDTNTADCPKDKVGDAMRLIDKYGGEIGDEVISTVAKRELNIELHSPASLRKVCGAGAVACNTGTTMVLPKGRSAVSLVGNIVHEVSHTILGGGFNRYVQEERQIRDRVMTVWGKLPSAMRAGGAYETQYRWWRRDPAEYHTAADAVACNWVLANGGTC